MATGIAEPLPPSTPIGPTYTYPPLIIILTIVLLIFFFAGFFSIYFCRCFMQNLLCTWPRGRGRDGVTPASGASVASGGCGTGLDPSIVESFPSFTYSTVKEYTKERYGLECAICLVEFRSSDVLRLLTACCHVFHQECIDLWFESHKTCPVCRRNLNSPIPSPEKSTRVSTSLAAHTIEDSDSALDAHPRDSCSITIKVDDENENEKEEEDATRVRVSVSEKDGTCDTCTTSAQSDKEKFSRSHSTGHSITINREGDDRFTLILPEEVKSQIIKGHKSSKSWTNFGEYNINDKNISDNIAETSGVAAADDKV